MCFNLSVLIRARMCVFVEGFLLPNFLSRRPGKKKEKDLTRYWMSPPSSWTLGRIRVSSSSLIMATTSESSARISVSAGAAPAASVNRGSPALKNRSEHEFSRWMSESWVRFDTVQAGRSCSQLSLKRFEASSIAGGVRKTALLQLRREGAFALTCIAVSLKALRCIRSDVAAQWPVKPSKLPEYLHACLILAI